MQHGLQTALACREEVRLAWCDQRVAGQVLVSSSPTDPQSELAGVRFGRTLVLPHVGTVLDAETEAVTVPANRRGVMGVGVAGLVRLEGGADIEREVMAHAPLTPGTAVTSTSGDLSARGIRVVIHAVVADSIGTYTTEATLRRATTAVLEAADAARVRSIALPLLAVGQWPTRADGESAHYMMLEEIVAHLRRFTSRFDRIVIVCRDERESDILESILLEARRQWWGLRV